MPENIEVIIIAVLGSNALLLILQRLLPPRAIDQDRVRAETQKLASEALQDEATTSEVFQQVARELVEDVRKELEYEKKRRLETDAEVALLRKQQKSSDELIKSLQQQIALLEAASESDRKEKEKMRDELKLRAQTIQQQDTKIKRLQDRVAELETHERERKSNPK